MLQYHPSYITCTTGFVLAAKAWQLSGGRYGFPGMADLNLITLLFLWVFRHLFFWCLFKITRELFVYLIGVSVCTKLWSSLESGFDPLFYSSIWSFSTSSATVQVFPLVQFERLVLLFFFFFFFFLNWFIIWSFAKSLFVYQPYCSCFRGLLCLVVVDCTKRTITHKFVWHDTRSKYTETNKWSRKNNLKGEFLGTKNLLSIWILLEKKKCAV